MMRTYNSYELKIINYIQELKGCILICSRDISFRILMKNIITNLVGDDSAIHIIDKYDRILDSEKELLQKYNRVLVFIEKYIHGDKTEKLLSQIKEICQNNCEIIYLTSEEDLFTFSELCSLCIDNIIVKPISIPNLIEKMVNTINHDHDISILVDTCQFYIERQELDKAKDIIDSIRDKKNNSTIANILYGDLCFVQNKYDLAEFYYKEAMNTTPLQARPLYKLIKLYNELGIADKRLNCLLKLQTLVNYSPELKIEIGDCYKDLGNYKKSKECYSHALKLLNSLTVDNLKLKNEISERIESLNNKGS